MLANKFKGVVVSKLTYDEIKNIKFIHTIFSEEQIKKRIAEIGAQITNDYKDKEKDGIVVVSVLKGAVIFMADLVRAIDLNCEIDFMAASSYYNSNKSSGRLKIEKDVSEDLHGNEVNNITITLKDGKEIKQEFSPTCTGYIIDIKNKIINEYKDINIYPFVIGDKGDKNDPKNILTKNLLLATNSDKII